jgi:hypothetical protein
MSRVSRINRVVEGLKKATDENRIVYCSLCGEGMWSLEAYKSNRSFHNQTHYLCYVDYDGCNSAEDPWISDRQTDDPEIHAWILKRAELIKERNLKKQ